MEHVTLIEEKSKAIPNTKIRSAGFMRSTLLLSLCVLSIYFFEIEATLQLPKLSLLLFAGFILHNLFPAKFRLQFTVGVTVFALFLLYEPLQAGFVLFVLTTLIVILESPIQYALKRALSILIGLGLVLMNLDLIEGVNFTLAATVLGGLFMFRLILYLHELKHKKLEGTFWQRVSYFLILPNLIFFLFPVIDFKTYVRNYYTRPAHEIYNKGTYWIALGVLQLLTYRVIYYYIVPNPQNLEGLLEYILYAVSSYALIVRLVGIFNIAAGALCLFGFDLPPTFKNVFLASGFNDLWRRVNIYWKDFVMKVFYFPIYFKIRKRIANPVFVSIMIVFLLNLLLHTYQWFWITGKFTIKGPDILFWGSFGLLVGFSSAAQKKRKLKSNESLETIFEAMKHTGKVIGIFTLMCVLWSIWISNSVSDWGLLINRAMRTDVKEILTVALGILLLFGVGTAYFYFNRATIAQNPKKMTLPAVYVSLFAITIFGPGFVQDKIQDTFQLDLSPIYSSQLNEFDENQQFVGYYETLLAGNNLSSRMWEQRNEEGHNKQTLQELGALQFVTDLREKVLKPNTTVEFKGVEFTSNSLGFHDMEYPRNKDANTIRIVLLGGSVEMGSGIPLHLNFENLVEKKLNEEKPWPPCDKIEILNLSLSALHLPNQVGHVRHTVPSLDADMICYFIHDDEILRSLRSFARISKGKIPFDDQELSDIFERSGVNDVKGIQARVEKLFPFKYELMSWGFDEIKEATDDMDLALVFIYIETLGSQFKLVTFDEIESFLIKRKITRINLGEVFKGHDKESLKLNRWDSHPNILGNQIIADTLSKELISNPDFNQIIDNILDKMQSN